MTTSQIAAHLSPWELFIQADAIVRSIMLGLLALCMLLVSVWVARGASSDCSGDQWLDTGRYDSDRHSMLCSSGKYKLPV
jgi:hypothetical protein